MSERNTPTEEECVLHGWRVIYEHYGNGWTAYTPDLPTILCAVETREEVLQQMAEAIPLHLESLREDRAQRPWLYTPEQLGPELTAVFARIDAA